MNDVIFFGPKNVNVEKAYMRILFFFSLWCDTLSSLWKEWKIFFHYHGEAHGCQKTSLKEEIVSPIVPLLTFSCHCGQWHYSWESLSKSNFYQGRWLEFDPWIPPGRRKEPTQKSCALISIKGPWQVFANIHTYIRTFIFTYIYKIKSK